MLQGDQKTFVTVISAATGGDTFYFEDPIQ